MDEKTESIIFNEIIELKKRINTLSLIFANAVADRNKKGNKKMFAVEDYMLRPEHLKKNEIPKNKSSKRRQH